MPAGLSTDPHPSTAVATATDGGTSADITVRVVDLGKRFDREYGSSHGHLRDRIGERFSRRKRPERGSEVTWALRHVDFAVGRGRIFGVIGRNGSGKTTLLSLLANVTAPTEGRAELHGRVAPLLAVGTGFHPQLTGRGNIALNCAILGMSAEETDEQMSRMIEFSEVGDYIDQPVKHYSSGMYARLAYSVVAFLPSEIMLVDEVLAVGDAAFKKKSEAHMRAALQDGRTVIYVGHAMETIRSLATDAIVLDAGRVVFNGAADDAIAYYEEEIVPRPPDLDRRGQVDDG